MHHDCLAASVVSSKSVTRFISVGNASKNPSLVEFAPGTTPQNWAALLATVGVKKNPLKS